MDANVARLLQLLLMRANQEGIVGQLDGDEDEMDGDYVPSEDEEGDEDIGVEEDDEDDEEAMDGDEEGRSSGNSASASRAQQRQARPDRQMQQHKQHRQRGATGLAIMVLLAASKSYGSDEPFPLFTDRTTTLSARSRAPRTRACRPASRRLRDRARSSDSAWFVFCSPFAVLAVCLPKQ